MCALYAHGFPYAARARTLVWVVLGMVASVAVALTAAALVDSAALLVLLASLLAAVHKVACDATRIGPPGNLIFTFLAASSFFSPQHLADVPFHTGLALLGGALAWLICMAPALVRPRGPERIATARALEAAARLLRTPVGDGAAGARADRAARSGTAAAVNAAWHTLFLVSGRSTAAAVSRAGLERLLVRAESALSSGATGAEASGEAELLLGWARGLRAGAPLPSVQLTPAQAEELAGVAVEREAGAAGEAGHNVGREAGHAVERGAAHTFERGPGPARGAGCATARSGPGVAVEGGRLARNRPAFPARRSYVLHRLREPGSPLRPLGLRVAAGCALAGWASLAAGVGHPYWAVVTAASVFQANTSLSWQRAVQRTLGNLLGLLVFALLLPVIGLGPLAMVLLAFVLVIGAEALMPRNYWLGSVCVTPMALLLSEFGADHPAGELMGDRLIDTVLGAAVGVLVCLLVTNRRAAGRIDAALARVAHARDEAALATGSPDVPRQRACLSRDRLIAALGELREAMETASGEWWQRALPEERVAVAEREGHQALTRLAHTLGARVTTG
ncbi:FUSC family protein [Streptomyces iconiensis]|uniref:FUSC family protein n=2 Tax=Streptomyces iconiensis TaxID=1384038 RepID=A0ABT6ZS82_9ACTN|nr:FUSC family protein [Streptomyces iconiensis]MDJ1131929.1 FUSC family protein [Streptomyces iconiensis]